jgi:hypothetical protein
MIQYINPNNSPVIFQTDLRFVLCRWLFYNNRLVNKSWRNCSEEWIVRNGEYYYRELWCMLTGDDLLKQCGLVPFAKTFFG